MILVVILEKPVSVAHERVVGLMPKIRVPACSGKKIKIIVVGAAIAGRKSRPVAARDTLPHRLGQACENRPEDGEEPERPDEAGARGHDAQYRGERQRNGEAAEDHCGVAYDAGAIDRRMGRRFTGIGRVHAACVVAPKS